MKELKHLGAYGILINDNKILLIKKVGGPYDGKLDLPGGTIEYGEKPLDTFKRELLEEVGIEIKDYELLDADSVVVSWKYKGDMVKTHHLGIFYKILNYTGEIKNNIEIDFINDDSMGASFYDIDKLNKKELSQIAILELEKLGYVLKEYNESDI